MPKAEYRIGEKYVPEILIYILENDEVHSTSFRAISSHYKGVVSKAEELEGRGYLDIERQTQPIVKKTFRLTEKGEKIAKELKKIEEKMEELEG